MNKGLVAIPIIALLLFGVLGSTVIFTSALRIHVINTIDIAFDEESSQLVIMTLLSSTYNGKQFSQAIGEHLVFSNYQENVIKSEIEQGLDKTVESKCYKLTISEKFEVGKTITPKGEVCTPKEHTVHAKLVLPYNPNRLVETLTLVMN